MEKKIHILFGFVAGFILMLFLSVIAISNDIVINWDIFIVISLVLLIIVFVLKRKYIDNYSINDASEYDFEITEADEIFIDYRLAHSTAGELNFDFKNFKIKDNVNKEYIIIKSSYEYYKLDKALKFGNDMGYMAADWADLSSLSLTRNKDDYTYHVIATTDKTTMNGQNVFIPYLDSQNQIKLTFDNIMFDGDFALLMVKNQEKLD